ncbi:NUDIX hydrolase [Microbacterium gorillae]|uniref:NUDIX hydrolase n=1 Tax=Microbacterium gorillae TaxID=1231063 RepID=UPI00058F0303|nr:NUDIX domain-containing protein [Microbacterium gorillae]
MAHTLALVPASYLLLRRGEEVLLQLRQNTGYMDGCWTAGAAGHVEPGETARDAAVREAAEELGVSVARDDLTLVTVMQRTDGTENAREQRVDWFWTARDWKGAPEIREPAKTAALRWWPLGGLPVEIPEYERLVLDGLRAGSLAADTAVGFTNPATAR